ncbi:holo-[acyl-carrier-protein] synthase [Bradyrhizobium canariense]|uniref:holo-ACP synthase n=1 Tax=Bradyrhizobium canariense TaxID=255045 RepID=UPI000A2488A2|nr:holo-ACP synthase [Bradyrhizobium canariense]OSI65613.1 holo-[acyl-carrier-protein] synthase [Bradyrhizobium canariense]
MIIGMGIDIHEVERTAEAVKRRGVGYLERLFTASEIEAGRHRRDAAGFFAKRFAAKEACAKALGTGISGRIGWQDIEISADGLGAPTIALSGGALRRARWLAPKGSEITAHVSLASASGMCVAIVVVDANLPRDRAREQLKSNERLRSVTLEERGTQSLSLDLKQRAAQSR